MKPASNIFSRMLNVHRDICGYCGCCVSVCPEGALELIDAYLSVEENCTSAVSAPRSVRLVRWRSCMKSKYDVLVIGGGPAGALAARTAAEKGLSACLVEKRPAIGAPVRCAEGIGKEALAEFIEPDPRWISAR